MTEEELRKLDDKEVAFVQRLARERGNEKTRKRVEEVLKPEVKTIVHALTVPPFIYKSPEIKIFSSSTAIYATLTKEQVDDAHEQLDIFIRRENPNDMRVADHLNQLLLAHSLTKFNGEDFGGVIFDAVDYQTKRQAAPTSTPAILAAIRDQRLLAIGALSPNIYQRLIDYYQAFQIVIEALTEDADDALKN